MPNVAVQIGEQPMVSLHCSDLTRGAADVAASYSVAAIFSRDKLSTVVMTEQLMIAEIVTFGGSAVTFGEEPVVW